ncbi:hypothetical protein DFP72DRAFT_880772 [Ephemerocybe angulata]|uniref:Uncharacterized protein n=1 Tax=Ephemerocybe angulata TaxID=980116 RepID=A0A8H6M9W8_9AGAR|nr:hypothetical protein DFP72DRAFT_880772 [Tulosesus angulatus]
MCTSTSYSSSAAVAQAQISLPTSSAPAASSTSAACIDHSSPQCCHCGWRGTHSPSCPFNLAAAIYQSSIQPSAFRPSIRPSVHTDTEPTPTRALRSCFWEYQSGDDVDAGEGGWDGRSSMPDGRSQCYRLPQCT